MVKQSLKFAIWRVFKAAKRAKILTFSIQMNENSNICHLGVLKAARLTNILVFLL